MSEAIFGQETQSWSRNIFQDFPHNLVANSTHIEGNAFVELPRFGNDEGIRDVVWYSVAEKKEGILHTAGQKI